MTRRTFIIILAVLVALTPFLGFPLPYEHAYSVVAGLLIAFLAYISRGKDCLGCDNSNSDIKPRVDSSHIKPRTETSGKTTNISEGNSPA